MGVKERRERDKAELREKILTSARSLFADKGYASVTIRDIAKLTEYSVPTLYSYFKDKESIIVELVQHDINQIKHTALEAAQKKSTPEERLLEMGRSFLETLRACPEQFRFLMQTAMSNVPPHLIKEQIDDASDRFMKTCFDEILGRPITPQEFEEFRAMWVVDIFGIMSLTICSSPVMEHVCAEHTFERKGESLIMYLKSKKGPT